MSRTILLIVHSVAALHRVDWKASTISQTQHGRGLVATKHVERGEAVLTVPRELTMNVERDPEWLTRLSFKLAEEIHAGDTSPHAEFVKTLPAPPRAPHRWTAAELELLQNDTLASDAMARA